MKFLLCSTDEETFDNFVITTSPVVGIAERFVVPCEVYFDDCSDNVPFDLYSEEMAELGITLLSIV